MKIYTRSGDRGETSLFSGERVFKDSLRVEAYGTLDELNSVLGVVGSVCRNPRVGEHVALLQNSLFNAGADMATSLDAKRQPIRISSQHTSAIEEAIDALEEELPGLKNFILPGGSQAAAFLHMARSVCRRAERLLVHLMREEKMNEELLVYLNRLSDFLFVLARYENIKGGGQEVLWKG